MHAPYPTGYTGESAFYETQGPADQAAHALRRLIADCNRHVAEAPKGWDAGPCEALVDEAREFLEDLA
ncbi:MAG: hypothetical protein HRU13_09070 [Phycisphaerales bacterium]|nr:hypothetical protein [Phycisphaerales bacterium]